MDMEVWRKHNKNAAITIITTLSDYRTPFKIVFWMLLIICWYTLYIYIYIKFFYNLKLSKYSTYNSDPSTVLNIFDFFFFSLLRIHKYTHEYNIVHCVKILYVRVYLNNIIIYSFPDCLRICHCKHRNSWTLHTQKVYIVSIRRTLQLVVITPVTRELFLMVISPFSPRIHLRVAYNESRARWCLTDVTNIIGGQAGSLIPRYLIYKLSDFFRLTKTLYARGIFFSNKYYFFNSVAVLMYGQDGLAVSIKLFYVYLLNILLLCPFW